MTLFQLLPLVPHDDSWSDLVHRSAPVDKIRGSCSTQRAGSSMRSTEKGEGKMVCVGLGIPEPDRTLVDPGRSLPTNRLPMNLDDVQVTSSLQLQSGRKYSAVNAGLRWLTVFWTCDSENGNL